MSNVQSLTQPFNLYSQELLTRHKSTVAEFLIKNEDWVSLSDLLANSKTLDRV